MFASSLLGKPNTTGADVVKTPPDLMSKDKGNTSMVGKVRCGKYLPKRPCSYAVYGQACRAEPEMSWICRVSPLFMVLVGEVRSSASRLEGCGNASSVSARSERGNHPIGHLRTDERDAGTAGSPTHREVYGDGAAIVLKY